MPYLVTAVVLVALLGAVNLLLTLGVIRRLREHTELLSAAGTPEGPAVIAAGARPTDFAAVSVEGEPVRPDILTGQVLVAFFSSTCQACREKLPLFLAAADRFPGGPRRVFTVVSGQGSAVADLTAPLAAVSRVVVVADEERDSDRDILSAFQIGAYPSWCLLRDGTVVDSGVGLDRLPDLVPA